MELKNYKKHIYWLIPSIIYLISSFFSVINVDGVRDYLEAYKIAKEGQYTLVGPKLAFSFHIAPLWYYFLSLVLRLSKSWMFLSVFVTSIAMFKFYIAFKFGQLLQDKKLSIVLIAMMMIPSFTLIQQITFTHTNLIELAILSLTYYCFIFNQNSTKSWFIFGLSFGVAIHIHPTTGVVAYWAILNLIKSKRKFVGVISALVGFLIPFLPIIYFEISHNYENLKGVVSYFSQHTNKVDSEGFFELFLGSLFVAPYDMLDMLFTPILAKLIFGLYCLLLMFFSFLGISSYSLIEKKDKTLMLKLVGFYLFSLLFVYFVRDKTPWYMTYSLTLSFNLMFSMIIWISLKKLKNKSVQLYLYWISLTIFLMSLISLIVKLNKNDLYVHGVAWNNIRTLSTKKFDVTGFEIPAYLAKEHTQYLCKNSEFFLHGPYATLIHSHSGIEVLAGCPESHILYGFSEGNNKNILAIPGIYARHIKREPLKVIGDAFFYTVKSVSNQQFKTEEDFLSEYKRTYKYQKDWKRKKVKTTLQTGNQLVLSKLFGSFSHLKIYEVLVNGKPIQLKEKTNYSTFYQCKDCDVKSSIWQVEYSESVSGSTNIVSF